MKTKPTLVIIFSMLVLACSTNESLQENSSKVPPRETQEPSSSNWAPRIAETTSTSQPTRTPNPTSTPTWTPQPAPSILASVAITDASNRNKDECRLPCVWEITPGESRWVTVEAYLQSINLNILNIEKNTYGVLGGTPSQNQENGLIFVENEVVKFISTAYSKEMPLYKLLSDYGKPTYTWICGVSAYSPTPEAQYILTLYYQDKGIMAMYHGETQKDQILRICPNKLTNADHPNLLLWDPSFKMNRAIAFAIWPIDDLANIYPLARATNIDDEHFYNTYQSPENMNVCFEMPVRNAIQQLPPNWNIVEHDGAPPVDPDVIGYLHRLGYHVEIYSYVWMEGIKGVRAEYQCEHERDDSGKCENFIYSIQVGEEEVYRTDGDGLRNLIVTDDGWLIDVVTTPDDAGDEKGGHDILLNGISLNKQEGYDESFGLHILEEKPFYFFLRNDQYGFVYDAIEYALEYDQIGMDHDWWRLRRFENGVLFFAKYKSRTYYVVMGVIEP